MISPSVLIRSIIRYESIIIGLLPYCIYPFEQQPTLECFTDGLRLHFKPEKPFYGHIYVKGFFMNDSCHLDYTRNPLYDPFFFHVPYRSGCNVRREKQSNPPGIIYHVDIIVQHHYLFLTQADKAYSVSCFYRETFDNVIQDMEVSGLSPTELSNEDAVPTCLYVVLKDSINGGPVKYASIGDNLIHKWSCASEEYGMLVHSCLVRDPDGVAFQLIDDRGCITDHTLIDPLQYEENLTVAHSLVPAFKFADQLVVRFQCKITLCRKEENGCEGITPPTCKIITNPSIDLYEPDDETEKAEGRLTPGSGRTSGKSGSETEYFAQYHSTNMASVGDQVKTNKSAETDIEPSGYSDTENNAALENGSALNMNIDFSMIPGQEHLGYRRMRSVEKLKMTADQHSQKFRMIPSSSDSSDVDRYTLDVNADQLVVFGRDETANDFETPYVSCRTSRNGIILQSITFILLSLIAISIILAQKRFYDKRLIKCNSLPNYETNVRRW